MFSIVIPLYNKEQSVTNTLQSVLNQTFTEFEVVIVNDGSTDNSVEKVEAFNDPRIRLIHQANAGVSAARNKGIKEANYEWIAFLDADDLWMEDHLSTLIDMIETYPEHKAFCNSYVLSSKRSNLSLDNDEVKIIDDYFVEAIKYHFFWTGVVCLHKSLFEKVGYFNTKLSRGEDLDVWMRIGRYYSIIWRNRITAIYNQETENKATKKKTNLENSIVFYLDFKSKNRNEIKYIKQIVIGKIKSLLYQKEFKSAMKLCLKYNIKLL